MEAVTTVPTPKNSRVLLRMMDSFRKYSYPILLSAFRVSGRSHAGARAYPGFLRHSVSSIPNWPATVVTSTCRQVRLDAVAIKSIMELIATARARASPGMPSWVNMTV